jgi:hypothetical protein
LAEHQRAFEKQQTCFQAEFAKQNALEQSHTASSVTSATPGTCSYLWIWTSW